MKTFLEASTNSRRRIVSGFTLAAVAAVIMVAGGSAFTVFCAGIGSVILWELANLSSPGVSPLRSIGVGVAAFIAFCAIEFANLEPGLALAAGVAAALSVVLPSGRLWFAAYGMATAICASTVSNIRVEYGFMFALWIILVVLATDICGYYGGRRFRGPLLAPVISPKKTWSGAASGWVGAVILGIAFSTLFQWVAIWASLLLSMSAQASDMAESKLKRVAGVKESSNLVPGHGGVSDRFDGMVGASLCLLILEALGMFEAGAG